ncbi:MAG: class I SAM-dependent methyltransferase [Verrucomicrobiota bacterium JB023]|nr:class I SAM-dependent methyltransferase [Verrucomicrobiota bacterium JB023]
MRATEQAKRLVRDAVQAGDQVIDATLGNGHDAVFLAQLVGAHGMVHGFDVQAQAIESSRQRLREAGLLERCKLLRQGHETLADVVSHPVSAVMFNLGYLPGSDKERITQERSTVAALSSASALLRKGGVITVVCYVGHPGGLEEAGAVVEWTRSLTEDFAVEIGEREGVRPFLVAVRRVGEN